ncbi:MAG: Trk system potassium transporter TrkA [Oscillospiraceae bacterium]
MKIIIVGSGKVGFTLAENLAAEHHDITIIDTRDEAIRKASDMLDVLCIKGNGASIRVLRSAGVEKCDVFIAATSRDELNMISCLTAKKLGAKYTIARIRDYEYAVEISQLKKEMEIDMVINPEFATASQISRLLRFPNALDIDTFYRGRIELIGFRACCKDVITGQPLSSVRRHLLGAEVLFCAVEHNGKTIIPDGSTVIEEGDKVYVIGDSLNVSRFFKALGRITVKIKNAFIIGGGRIGMYLASSLIAMNMDVKIIEMDHKKCVELTERLPKALVVQGDGTDQELLASENIAHSGAFIALTDRDEDNLIMSLYAKQLGVPKVIVKINRQNYYGISSSLSIDSIISPKTITAFAILKNVRAMQNSQGSRMEALFRIAEGSVEAMEFTVSARTRNLGIPLRDLKLKKGILLAVIVRKGQFIIPEGGDHIEDGDNIIIIAKGLPILDINDIYLV